MTFNAAIENPLRPGPSMFGSPLRRNGLPVVLMGDSGQHDPAIYRRSVERYGERILAVYIRDVSARDGRIRGEIEAMETAIRAAGSDLVLATDTVAMAEHAAMRGLVASAAVDMVRGRQPIS